MDRGSITIYKEVLIKEFLPDPVVQPKKMAWMSMRKLGRLSKSGIKLGFITILFCTFLYLTNLAYPPRVIGPSGEKISQNSSFFILENELNSVSLLNDTMNGTEGILLGLPLLANIPMEDINHDDNDDEDDDDNDDDDDDDDDNVKYDDGSNHYNHNDGMLLEKSNPQQINYARDFYHDKNELYDNGTAGAKYIFGHEYVNKPLCARHGRDYKGVIIVHSFPVNRKKRMAIRRTWGEEAWKKGLIVAFFLGQLEGENTKGRVRDEIEKFEDVIIGNFVERYYELPIKTMSMLEWVNYYCNRAPFIVKSDDDVFINVINLLSFLEINDQKKGAIYGRILRVQPVRNPRSKYYISEKAYPGPMLPPYAQGFCYIIHRELIQDMFYMALNTTYMEFEDLFVTGMVAQKLNIPRVKSSLFPNFKHGAPSPCQALKVIGMHKVTADEQFEMHDITMGERRCH